MIGFDETAKAFGVDRLLLAHIIDVGDVLPSQMPTGSVWQHVDEIKFSPADLIAFAAELRERRFEHIFEQHGYVVPPDAEFACGKGWERVIRKLATGLSAIPGPPPRFYGGKEKFGSFIAFVSCEDDQRKEVQMLKEAARKQSLRVCDECGAPGRFGWVYRSPRRRVIAMPA
ncbi:hypothetical protein ACCS95_34485 [Rhizobium ruizarguesonis]